MNARQQMWLSALFIVLLATACGPSYSISYSKDLNYGPRDAIQGNPLADGLRHIKKTEGTDAFLAAYRKRIGAVHFIEWERPMKRGDCIEKRVGSRKGSDCAQHHDGIMFNDVRRKATRISRALLSIDRFNVVGQYGRAELYSRLRRLGHSDGLPILIQMPQKDWSTVLNGNVVTLLAKTALRSGRYSAGIKVVVKSDTGCGYRCKGAVFRAYLTSQTHGLCQHLGFERAVAVGAVHGNTIPRESSDTRFRMGDAGVWGGGDDLDDTVLVGRRGLLGVGLGWGWPSLKADGLDLSVKNIQRGWSMDNEGALTKTRLASIPTKSMKPDPLKAHVLDATCKLDPKTGRLRCPKLRFDAPKEIYKSRRKNYMQIGVLACTNANAETDKLWLSAHREKMTGKAHARFKTVMPEVKRLLKAFAATGDETYKTQLKPIIKKFPQLAPQIKPQLAEKVWAQMLKLEKSNPVKPLATCDVPKHWNTLTAFCKRNSWLFDGGESGKKIQAKCEVYKKLMPQYKKQIESTHALKRLAWERRCTAPRRECCHGCGGTAGYKGCSVPVLSGGGSASDYRRVMASQARANKINQCISRCENEAKCGYKPEGCRLK